MLVGGRVLIVTQKNETEAADRFVNSNKKWKRFSVAVYFASEVSIIPGSFGSLISELFTANERAAIAHSDVRHCVASSALKKIAKIRLFCKNGWQVSKVPTKNFKKQTIPFICGRFSHICCPSP